MDFFFHTVHLLVFVQCSSCMPFKRFTSFCVTWPWRQQVGGSVWCVWVGCWTVWRTSSEFNRPHWGKELWSCEVFISGCRRTLRRGDTVRDERRVSWRPGDGNVTFTLTWMIFIRLVALRQFRVSSCQPFQHWRADSSWLRPADSPLLLPFFSTHALTFHPDLPISVLIQRHHHGFGLRHRQLPRPWQEILKEPSDGKIEIRNKFKLTHLHTHIVPTWALPPQCNRSCLGPELQTPFSQHPGTNQSARLVRRTIWSRKFQELQNEWETPRKKEYVCKWSTEMSSFPFFFKWWHLLIPPTAVCGIYLIDFYQCDS